MTDKTKQLLTKHILPYYEKQIRIYERDKACDKDCIKIMKNAISQFDYYISGINDKVGWNAIRFINDAIIPLEERKKQFGLEYYEKSREYDDCIEDLKKLAIELDDKMVKTQSRGLILHFDMFGKVVKKQEIKKGKIIDYEI